MAIGLVSGVLIGSGHEISTGFAIVTSIVFFTLSLKFGFAVIFLGFFLGVVRIEVAEEKPHNHLQNFLPNYYQFVGTIQQAPWSIRPPKRPVDKVDPLWLESASGYFIVRVDYVFINNKRVNSVGSARIAFEEIKFTWDGKDTFLEEDDVVLVRCALSQPHKTHNPGQFDFEGFLNRHDIYRVGLITQDHQISIVKRPNTARKLLYQIRSSLRDRFYEYMDYDSASFLTALILGFQQGLSQELRETFQRIGTAHLIAISGLHLVMVLNILWIVSSLLRIQGAKQVIVIIISLLVYALLAGFNVPVVRSLLMIIVYIFADAILKRPDSLCSLSAAVIALLIINPYDLFEIGFQLSFLAVLSIIVAYKTIYNLLSMDKRNWIVEYLKSGVAMSTCSFIFLLPLMANYFFFQPNVSIIANLLMYPLIFLLMTSGFLFLIFGYIPALAVVGGWTIDKLLIITQWLGESLSRLPLAFVQVSPLPYWLCFLFYLILALWLVIAARRPKPVLLFGLLIFPIFSSNWERLKSHDEFTVAVLDVRDGQCVYTRVNGQDILFNCGSSSYGNPARQVAIPFLLSRGVKKIDYFVVSSENMEYASGALEMISNFRVGELILPQGFSKGAILELARSRGINVRFIQSAVDMNGFMVLNFSDSIALRVENKLLLLGRVEGHLDRTDLAEKVVLLPNMGLEAIDWSKFISTRSTVIISSGKIPSKKILDKIDETGGTLYSTHRDGAIILK